MATDSRRLVWAKWPASRSEGAVSSPMTWMSRSLVSFLWRVRKLIGIAAFDVWPDSLRDANTGFSVFGRIVNYRIKSVSGIRCKSTFDLSLVTSRKPLGFKP